MAYELALRVSNFRPGTAVRLADGQTWNFPAPPEESDADLESFGPEYPALLAAIGEAEDLPERRRGELLLAVLLLDRNYDLQPDQLRELLDCPSGGEEAQRLQRMFADLASEHLRKVRRSEVSRPATWTATRRVRVFEGLVRFARPQRQADPTP